MREVETSIVIRSYNEERHLPSLLQALREQTYDKRFEVIVVDSGSVDLTREIARKYADKVVEIDNDDFTFGYSLNVGIEESVGKYICIISAHALPVESNWLTYLVSALHQLNVAMVFGRQMGVPSSKFSEGQDFARLFGPRPFVVKPPNYFANNANSAIRRELWEEHKFDETLLGLEDVEWMKYWIERGHVGFYEPRAAIYHIHQETWCQIRRRFYREAVTKWQIGIQSRRDIPGEFIREGRNAFLDVIAALRRGVLATKLTEIVRFRFEKGLGTGLGLWSGPQTSRDPEKRHDMFFGTKYKAVVVQGPGRVSLAEVDLARVKPGDVLIKVAYVGVCATDLEIFEGSLGYYRSGMAKYPIIPGHEFSGRIAKVGQNVRDIREGDPVVAECIQSCGVCEKCQKGNWIGCEQRKEVGVIGKDGAYAKYVVLPGHFVHKLPIDVNLKEACLCEPLAVVLKGLKRLKRAWGADGRKTCAVVGVGPIGHLCAIVLAFRGHEVAVIDRNPLRRGYIEAADVAIQTSAELGILPNYEIVVEATGDPEVLDGILHYSTAGSSLLLLGLPYARRNFNFESIVAYDRTIIGSVGSTAQDFQDAIAILPQLDLKKFTQAVYPLEEFEAAWQACRLKRHLKTILEVDSSLNER